MILSRNFIKDYIDLNDDIDIKDIAENMTRVGNEYDTCGKLINCTNLTIGKVISCKDHPDSDHLHVCEVDVKDKVLQIVCGAPNVREGIKVIVALDGAILPDGVIKCGKIRGVESNGMICSIKELGLDNKFLTKEDIEGIKELDDSAIVGSDPIKYLGLDDEVIDIDLTPDRADLLSIIGNAYELGAIYGLKVKDTEIDYTEDKENINDSFSIDINTDNCSLFLAKKAINVEIKESPMFIKNRLIASGIRPINNVVDISNYVMLETGQPLHFYDADNLGNKLIVDMAKDNEKLVTLDNIERTLSPNDIVIKNNKGVVGLAGVMGGLTTEIENTTKNVIIESAIFDGVKVRKTSKKIVRSEASNRFEKGLDPKRTYMAIDRACTLLSKYANATILSGMCKYDITDDSDKVINIEYQNINDVLGSNISKKEIIDVFTRLDFKCEDKGNYATVYVPSRRLDINIKEDLIEEVSRIYGVDNIEGKLPVLSEKNNDYDNTIRSIRHKMCDLGLNETLTYVLVNDKDAHKFTSDNFKELRLLDPITEDRNTLRYSVLQSLYKTYEYNKAHNNKDISIFEIGKGFYEMGESEKIAGLMTGKYYLGLNNTHNVDFYIVKGIVEELLEFLGYNGRYSFIIPNSIPSEFHNGQVCEINVNGSNVGILGKLHPNMTKDDVYAFEINLDELFKNKVGKMKFKEISKYPNVTKDIAFIVDKNITALEIIKVIKKAAGKILKDVSVFDVYVGDKIDNDKKSVAFNLTFEDITKTLTDEEVTEVFNRIIDETQKKLNAKVRDK